MRIRAMAIAATLWPVLVQAQEPAAARAPATPAAAKDSATPTESPASEPKRRLKFKGRGSSCLCAEPVGEDDIESAASAMRSTRTDPRPSRSN